MMRMSGRCRARRLIPLLWLCLLSTAGCGRRDQAAEAPKEPELIVSPKEVVAVASGRLEVGLSFSGQLEPSEVVEIKARFDGDLESVKVREGERVKRGQSLGSFRPAMVTGQWKAAEAEELAAKAALVAAENAARRAKRLLDAGAAAPSDLETADAQLKAAQARVEAAQASKTSAGENADDLRVPSPIDGSISKVVAHAGDRLAVGDPILTVVDTRSLELSATVPSEALSQVAPGTKISFDLDAYPNETWTGVVSRVNPTTEPGTRQLRIYTRVDNADGRLIGGLFATGHVVEVAKDNATTAPIAALRQEGGDAVVYALRGGRAARVVVELGLRDDRSGKVELLGNVGLGDTLLIGVLPGLRDSVRVKRLGS